MIKKALLVLVTASGIGYVSARKASDPNEEITLFMGGFLLGGAATAVLLTTAGFARRRRT